MGEREPISREELIEGLFHYVKETGGTTLRGQYFDISRDEGKRRYAEWLANEFISVQEWSEQERPREHHPMCVDPEGHEPDGVCPIPDDK